MHPPDWQRPSRVGIVSHGDRDQRFICLVFEDIETVTVKSVLPSTFFILPVEILALFGLPVQSKFSDTFAVSRLTIFQAFAFFSILASSRSLDIVTTQVIGFFLWLSDLLASLLNS